MTAPHVLLMANVHPLLVESLEKTYQLHEFLPSQSNEPLEGIAQDIQAIVAYGESRVTPDFLAQFPAAKLLAVWGVGYDGVDVAGAHSLGVSVTNTPDVLTDDVADLAMGLVLATARAIPSADRFVKAGKWGSEKFPLTRKVSGSRLGVVGLGRIGLAIAQRAEAFGMKISYSARQRKEDVGYPYYSSPQALAAGVDFLMVCTVGGNPTRGLIDAEVLNALGPEGILINVARGSVVDESALIKALLEKRIAAAALDVFVDEPNVAAELRQMDNVVLTPHMASSTLNTRIAMNNLVMQNLAAYFKGEALITPVSS